MITGAVPAYSQGLHRELIDPGSRLLLLVAQHEIAPVDGEELRDLALAVNWSSLLDEAQVHGLTAALLSSIRAYSLDAPAAVVQMLEARQFAWSLRLLALSEELLKINHLLEQKHVEMLAFKGPILGIQAFSRIGCRMSWDLDLIVRQKDIETIRKLLEGTGYELVPQGDGAHDYHFHLQHPNGFAVELHWAITPHYLPFDISMDQLFQRAETVQIGGTRIKAVSGEELLLLLCVHGAKHCWERLGWVRDVAALIKNRPNLDWARLLVLARGTGSLRMLLLGLVLASELLKAALPAEVLAEANRDEVLPSLLRRVLAQVKPSAETARFKSLERPDFLIRLRERRRDRAVYLWHWVRMSATPNEADLQVVRLPRHLRGLYYVIRPVRVLTKYLHLLVIPA